MNLELSGDQCVWLPCDVDEAGAETLIRDDNWLGQRKEDGVHVIAARTEKGLTTRNRTGTPHPIPAALAKAMSTLPIGTMSDGEKLHEGGYVVFDLMYLEGQDLRKVPYEDRFELATALCRVMNQPLIFPVITAFGTDEKRKLVETVRASRGEGCIFKDRRAPYTPGRFPDWRMNTMVRLKFRKSLTCILQRRPNDTKASFEMYLLDGDQPVNIGSVSAHRMYDNIKPGEVGIGECSYLYATPGQKLVQPVLVRFRDDKTSSDCLADQLVIGGRFAGRLFDSGRK